MKTFIASVFFCTQLSFLCAEPAYTEQQVKNLERQVADLVNRAQLKQPFTVAVIDGQHMLTSFACISWMISYRDEELSPFYTLYVKAPAFFSLSEREQLFVLAHELGHIHFEHPAQGLQEVLGVGITSGMISLGCMIKSAPCVRNKLLNVITKICAAGCIAYGVCRFGSVAVAMLDRKREFAADAYALKLTRDLEAAISVLSKRDELVQDINDGWYEQLMADHPSAQERIEALKKLYARMGLER